MNDTQMDPFGIEETLEEASDMMKALADGYVPEDEWFESTAETADEEWAQKRLRAIQQERAELMEITLRFAREKKQLDRWLADMTDSRLLRIEFLEQILEQWAAARIEADPDGPKQFKFPAGSVKRTKKAGQALQRPDDEKDEELIEFCVERGIPITQQVRWSDLKKHLEETGEAAPGVKMGTVPASYKVTITKEDT